MKTGQLSRSIWMAATVVALLASGCGARSVPEAQAPGPAAEAGVVASNTPAPAAVATATTGTNAPAAADESAPPPIRRSELAAVALPPHVLEVVKLVESGAGDEVVRAYVGSSQVPFELTLDQIIYLRDVGVPDGVIAAMMRRGSELRDRANEAESMQTNLVAAVEQIREAIGTNPPAANAGEGEAAAPAPPGPSPVVAAAPQAPADAPQEVTQFYSSLSPYGTWYQVPSYGWVWQPSTVVVNTGWAPYNHGGRWVWSDWGWYWSSDYSWGWAPFHYGRWCTYPGLGWCWVPGSVWGPSWVTWRHGGGHIGWAPLPPACGWSSGVGLTWYGNGVSVGFGFGLAASCYTFVPSHNFCHRNLSHYAVRGHESGAVYHNSTVVNNVIQGNNNVIVNNGVGYNTVASLTRNEVPKVRVKTLPTESNQPLRADRMERSKEGLVVYRPAPASAPAGGERPAPIRAEVRPSVSTPSSVAGVPGGGGRGPGNPPVRPTVGSRYGSAPAVAGKPVENRGGQAVGTAASPTPSGARPANFSTSRPTPSPASRPSVSRPATSTAPKVSENRGTGSAPSGAGNQGTPAGTLGPTRQTTPVPLGDPSRNIPSRSTAPSSRTVAPAAPTAKPVESRGATDSSASSRAYPSAVPRTDYQRPAASSYSAPSPSVSAPRPSYSAPSPVMSAPRPSYSAPSPVMSTPRPSYSAPSPVMSAPHPSYSAPSAPSVAPSRSAPMSTPSSAPSTPSSSPGSRGGGSRSQPN